MTEEFYKQVRNKIALGLVVAWIVGWYVYLTGQHDQTAKAAQACESGLRGIGCSSVGAVTVAVSGIGTFIGMVFVVLTSPFMFLPAGYAARQYVIHLDRQESERAEAAQIHVQQQLQLESRERQLRHDVESTTALRQISRSEIIHKLGSINDLIDLLQTEADPERLMNIRHGVALALRELAAKYPTTELASLIHSDEVIAHAARAAVQRLEESALSTIVEIQALKVAVQSV